MKYWKIQTTKNGNFKSSTSCNETVIHIFCLTNADEERKAREGKVAISDNYGSNNISGTIGSVLSIGSWWGGGGNSTTTTSGSINSNSGGTSNGPNT